MLRQEVVGKYGHVSRLGENRFGVLETPGHTPGTASYTFDVKDGGSTYRAVTIGGLGLNAIKNSKQVEVLIASLDQLSGMVKQPNQPLTVHVAAHTIFNGLMEARDKLLARKPSEPNALVDPETLLKMLATQRSGAETRLEIERKAGR